MLWFLSFCDTYILQALTDLIYKVPKQVVILQNSEKSAIPLFWRIVNICWVYVQSSFYFLCGTFIKHPLWASWCRRRLTGVEARRHSLECPIYHLASYFFWSCFLICKRQQLCEVAFKLPSSCKSTFPLWITAGRHHRDHLDKLLYFTEEESEHQR